MEEMAASRGEVRVRAKEGGAIVLLCALGEVGLEKKERVAKRGERGDGERVNKERAIIMAYNYYLKK